MNKTPKIWISIVISGLVIFSLLNYITKNPIIESTNKNNTSPKHISNKTPKKSPKSKPSKPSRKTKKVDQLLQKMTSANIVFNSPEKINIDETSQIQLLLSINKSIDKLKKLITEEGKKVGEVIKVSDRMEAHLTGRNFKITAVTPEIQAVSGVQNTEWIWEIQPTQEGQYRLYLTLTALLDINGHSTPRTIRSFKKNINVYVTGQQKLSMFFVSNWQWLWAAIAVPIAGFFWKRKRSFSKEN